MINLIPPHARRKVTKEYWIRTVTVWFFLLGIAFACIAVLFIPAYVLVQNQLAVYGEAYQSATADNEQFGRSKTAINTANTTAVLLASDADVDFSTVVREIRLAASPAIDITNLTISRVEEIIEPVKISGIADDRISLANFRDQLEGSSYFDSANLPLSNLAKDTDINFTITVTPATNI